jgi:hypothetical protein
MHSSNVGRGQVSGIETEEEGKNSESMEVEHGGKLVFKDDQDAGRTDCR